MKQYSEFIVAILLLTSFLTTNNKLSLHTQDRTFMLTSAYHFAVNSLRLHSAVVIVVGLCNERC